MDRNVKRDYVGVRAIGAPVVMGDGGRGLAPDLYVIDTPAVSDDTHRGRLVELTQAVDGVYLAQLFAAARAAGWTER